jgi:hypothetical protein
VDASELVRLSGALHRLGLQFPRRQPVDGVGRGEHADDGGRAGVLRRFLDGAGEGAVERLGDDVEASGVEGEHRSLREDHQVGAVFGGSGDIGSDFLEVLVDVRHGVHLDDGDAHAAKGT